MQFHTEQQSTVNRKDQLLLLIVIINVHTDHVHRNPDWEWQGQSKKPAL